MRGLLQSAGTHRPLRLQFDLPPSWRIHPAISVEHLEPAPSPDLFDREPADPEPTGDDRFPEDQDRHEVERVFDKRIRRLGRYRTPTLPPSPTDARENGQKTTEL